MTESTDEEIRALTLAAARGEGDAIDALLERFLPPLRAFVRLRVDALLREREDSMDLTQSVCREVLQNADRFRFPDQAAFKRWLFATALRKIAKKRRYWLALKRDVRRNVPVAAEGDSEERRVGAVLACYESFATPSAQVARREQLERIELASTSSPTRTAK